MSALSSAAPHSIASAYRFQDIRPSLRPIHHRAIVGRPVAVTVEVTVLPTPDRIVKLPSLIGDKIFVEQIFERSNHSIRLLPPFIEPIVFILTVE